MKKRGPWQNGIRWIIYKDGTKKWEAKVKIKGSEVYRTFETRKQARLWVNNRKAKRDRKEKAFDHKVMIQNLFDDYLLKHRRQNHKASTIKIDERKFNKYLKPYYKGLDLTDVTIEEHQTLFDEMEVDEKSPQMRDKVRTLLHAMFEYAVKKQNYDGAFPFNPIRAIDKPKFEKPDIKWLNPANIQKFLTENCDHPYYPLFITGFYTGLRIGELCGLDWEQIDTAHHILTVDRQWNEIEKRITTPKGRRFRHVGLITEVREVLYPLESKGLVFKKLTGRNLVGGKLLPNYFRKEIIGSACKKAKVKEIGPHGMRHSFAALWLIQGGTMAALQILLGHASIQTTEGAYGHLDFSHIRDQMGVISNVGNLTHVDFDRGRL